MREVRVIQLVRLVNLHYNKHQTERPEYHILPMILAPPMCPSADVKT